MTDLKPCPFCGSKDITADKDDGFDSWGLYCTDCGWGIPYEHVSKKDAIKLWNSRPLEDALTHRIEELELFVSRVSKEQSIGWLPTNDPHIFEDAKVLAQRLLGDSK